MRHDSERDDKDKNFTQSHKETPLRSELPDLYTFYVFSRPSQRREKRNSAPAGQRTVKGQDQQRQPPEEKAQHAPQPEIFSQPLRDAAPEVYPAEEEYRRDKIPHIAAEKSEAEKIQQRGDDGRGSDPRRHPPRDPGAVAKQHHVIDGDQEFQI
ncbi:hypothetical protein SDC9_161987 [bioreactor metagenome]|uniref:Uncharacterized protein n=1 Tax=bioreactor metagenome TaxID=1076179 RepID=A0A645FL41_9ZZZZ